MSARTGIEWTDATWNPVVGCTKVSQGCKHCYAKTIHDMRRKAHLEGKVVASQYAQPFETVQLKPERLTHPLSWQKSRRVFVNSVSDLFHDDVPFEFIAHVFAIMSLVQHHTFQVLTKRPQRMLAFFRWVESEGRRLQDSTDPWDGTNVVTHHACSANLGDGFDRALSAVADDFPPEWPLQNVWLGVSVENQAAANERIPLLLQTPAAVRFLSCEPLLGAVNILEAVRVLHRQVGDFHPVFETKGGIDWVIVGGESGKGARPMHPDWALSLRDQCLAADVALFFKQWGEFRPITPVYEMREEMELDAADDELTSVVAPDGSEWCIPGRPPMQPPPGSWFVERVGKKRAGRGLAGVMWNEFPASEVHA